MLAIELEHITGLLTYLIKMLYVDFVHAMILMQIYPHAMQKGCLIGESGSNIKQMLYLYVQYTFA